MLMDHILCREIISLFSADKKDAYQRSERRRAHTGTDHNAGADYRSYQLVIAAVFFADDIDHIGLAEEADARGLVGGHFVGALLCDDICGDGITRRFVLGGVEGQPLLAHVAVHIAVVAGLFLVEALRLTVAEGHIIDRVDRASLVVGAFVYDLAGNGYHILMIVLVHIVDRDCRRTQGGKDACNAQYHSCDLPALAARCKLLDQLIFIQIIQYIRSLL